MTEDKLIKDLTDEELLEVDITDERVVIPAKLKKSEILKVVTPEERDDLDSPGSILYHTVGKNKRRLRSVPLLLISGGR